MTYYIFAGRFQPFHIGHASVVRQLARCLATESNSLGVIAVVAPCIEGLSKAEEFSEVAEEHHLAERNPWPVPTRLAAIGEFLRAEKLTQLVVTALPRPDLGWDSICEWFPGKRVWVIPDASESFDERKVDYFTKLGEQVLRLPDRTNANGRVLRQLFLQGKSASLEEGVPNACLKHYYYLSNID